MTFAEALEPFQRDMQRILGGYQRYVHQSEKEYLQMIYDYVSRPDAKLGLQVGLPNYI